MEKLSSNNGTLLRAGYDLVRSLQIAYASVSIDNASSLGFYINNLARIPNYYSLTKYILIYIFFFSPFCELFFSLQLLRSEIN